MDLSTFSLSALRQLAESDHGDARTAAIAALAQGASRRDAGEALGFFVFVNGDWAICPCGNNPLGGGFVSANRDGTPNEAQDGDWSDHQTIACDVCGRYGRQTELGTSTPDAMPVLGVVDLTEAEYRLEGTGDAVASDATETVSAPLHFASRAADGGTQYYCGRRTTVMVRDRCTNCGGHFTAEDFARLVLGGEVRPNATSAEVDPADVCSVEPGARAHHYDVMLCSADGNKTVTLASVRDRAVAEALAADIAEITLSWRTA